MCGCGIGRCGGAWVLGCLAGAVSLWFTGDLYGFAHGSVACGVPGWGGAVGVGSVVVSRSRATGLRAQGGARVPPAALRGRLRGERLFGNVPSPLAPRGAGHCAAAAAACGPGPDPSSRRAPRGISPPTRGIRNLPPVGIGQRPRTTPPTSAAAGAAKARRWPPPREVGSGSLVASAQTAAHDGPTVSSPCHTKPPPELPDRRRHGLYSGGPSWYSQPQRRDEGSGPEPQAAPQPAQCPPTPQSEAARRAGAAGGIAPRLWARRPVAP